MAKSKYRVLARRSISPGKHTEKDGLSNPSNIDLIPDGIHKKIFPKRSNPGSRDDPCWSQVV